MSDTHQTTGSEQSSGTTTSQTSPSQANGGAPPAEPYYANFANKALAAETSITRWANVEELANGYVNLEKRFGIPEQRRIDLPEDMADAEAMKPVWSRLGLPGTPEGYNFKLADGATEGDTAMLGKYIAKAHEVGLPTPQARAMLEWWIAENGAAHQAAEDAMTQRRADGEQRLQKSFGNAYDARMREVKNLLTRYDPKGETGLTAENLSTFPAWTEMLIRMSDRMAEPEGGLGGETDQTDRPMTPGQASAKLNELALDEAKQAALFDEKHPGHKAVVEERKKLLEAANPRPGAAR
jgi:hypothetical protein